MWFQKPPLGTPLDWSNPLNDGVVLHLAMNEGHGDVVRDLSMNGNHGALSGFAFPPTVASGWNPGQTGTGLNFDGVNDYINCGDSLNLKSPHLTISALFYTSTIANEMTIVSTGETVATPGDGYILTTLSNKAAWRVYRADRTVATIYSNVLENDTWYHVVGTHDGTIAKIYVNGMYHNQGNVAGSSRGVKDIYIGRLRPVNRQFNGPIDQPRIHNRALTAKEVKDYYINPWQVYLDE